MKRMAPALLVLTAATIGAGGCQSAPTASSSSNAVLAETIPGLHYAADAAWMKQTPSSPARIAQYSIAPQEAEQEPSELIIYYFGRQGAGSVEDNITRWVGQFAEDEREVAPTDIRTRFGIRVHETAVDGRYVAEVRPGAAEHHNKPGFSLRAAVVESEAGPYYFRITGPSAAVDAQQQSWQRLLESLRPAPVVADATEDAAEHPQVDDG